MFLNTYNVMPDVRISLDLTGIDEYTIDVSDLGGANVTYCIYSYESSFPVLLKSLNLVTSGMPGQKLTIICTGENTILAVPFQFGVSAVWLGSYGSQVTYTNMGNSWLMTNRSALTDGQNYPVESYDGTKWSSQAYITTVNGIFALMSGTMTSLVAANNSLMGSFPFGFVPQYGFSVQVTYKNTAGAAPASTDLGTDNNAFGITPTVDAGGYVYTNFIYQIQQV
jgi:hypothetical protein